MSTIVSQLRTRYRAKLDRPEPASASCANSSQVRRMIDLLKNPQRSLYQEVRTHQRLLLAGTIAILAICIAIAYAVVPTMHATTAPRPLTVTTLILAQPEPCTTRREFVGTVLATQRSELGFVRPGRMKHRWVNEGDCVEAGALLAELDTSTILSELTVARSELKLAENKLKSLQTSQANLPAVRRTRLSLSDGSMVSNESMPLSRTQVEYWASVIKRLETQLEECQLRAPYNAVVTAVALSDGSLVSADRPILNIVGDEDLVVKVPMPVRLVETLSPQVEYEFAIGTRKVTGRLKTLLPDIHPVDQTRDVLFELPELSGTNVGVGTQASLQVDVPNGKVGYRVPKTAVCSDKEGSSFVAVVRTETKPADKLGNTQAVAHTTSVEVLQKTDDSFIIRGDVKAKDRLVAVLHEQLPAEQPVRYSDLAQWRIEAWLNLRNHRSK